jgi:hypothetical protein
MFTTSKPLVIGIFATICLAFPPAVGMAAENNGGDDYSMGQFKDDCEAAGGEVTWTEGTVVCNFEGDEEDIICSDKLGSGGLDVSDCQLGWVVERGTGGKTGPTLGGGQVIRAPGGLEIQLIDQHISGLLLRQLLQERAMR